MPKAKLRRLVVDGVPFLWRLSTSYRRLPDLDHVDCRSHYSFRVYREGFRNTPAIAEFEAWESPQLGGPLHTGAPIELADADSPRVNLNQPRFAAELVRLLLRRGWSPESDAGPFEWRGERAALDEIWARATSES